MKRTQQWLLYLSGSCSAINHVPHSPTSSAAKLSPIDTTMASFTSTTEAVLGNLLAKVVKFTPLLSPFVSYDVQDFGLLVANLS